VRLFQSALERLDIDLDDRILPEQNVMFEINGDRGELDREGRDQFALDVKQPRTFSRPGLLSFNSEG